MTVFIEPQFGATYDDQLRIARRAEECGYDAFFRSDHYLTMRGDGGLPGPTDAWITLAGLARETERIRLGTMVTSATFRLPGPLAISVAQVDQMSGGRVELGLGAGWFAAEHEAYAIPFPPVGERFDRLTEQLEIVTGLWATPTGETFDYSGKHYQVSQSPGLPKPTQRPGPTMIIGGAGAKRTPALAARFADEFNVPFRKLEETAEVFGRVAAAVEASDRAASGRAPLAYSVAQTIVCGRTDAEVRARAEAAQTDISDRSGGLYGTPDEIVARIGEFRQAGAQRVHLQFLDLNDPDHLDLVAAEVAPQLA